MRTVTLSQVSDINPKGPKAGSLPLDEEFDFVPMASVSEEGVITVKERRAYEQVAKGFTAFQNDDVLLAKITPCYENNKIAIANVSTPYGFGSTEFHVLRCDRAEIDPRYLTYYLRQDRIRYAGERRMTGSAGQRRVPKAFLEELEIPLPPLKEQKRIAVILDQADALRTARQRALDKLNTLGQSIFYEMFGDPATNPYDFEKCNLVEIINFVGGSQPAKSNFLYEDAPDRVRFIQIRDFRTDQYKTYVPKELAKRPFTKEDVMIGRYGPPVFQIFRGLSGTYNVALMKAEPKNSITSDFIFYLLQEHKLHSYVVANSERTAGQSGVNLRLLENYPAYKPPIELQKEFSLRISTLRELMTANTVQGNWVENLFASLQQRAFKGEL